MSLEWLEAYNVVEITGGSISAVLGLFGLFLATTGPFGALIIGIAGLALAITILIVTTTLDLIDMVSVWTNGKADIICCLYNALNTDEAKTCVNDYLLSTELDSGETFFIMQFLPTGVVSLLFADTDESAVYFDGYESDFDCAQCIEELATDWVLAPSGMFGATSNTGFQGSGTVLNDGNQFVINSVPRANQAGVHIIGLILRVYLDDLATNNSLNSPVVCQSLEGQVTRHDGGTGPWNAKVGRRCFGAMCGSNPSAQAPPDGVGAFTGFIAIYYQKTSSFSLTFSVNSPPTLCP